MKDQKRKLEAIFHAARELSDPDQREIYIRDACQGDPTLRAKVEGLLRASVEAESVFADSNTVPEAPKTIGLDVPIEESAGTVVGRYKLLQKIGEGGMGVVYMAEQTEPVTRKVALKIIKLGMDTRQVVARFEAERQALAMMDHPNIAKVLDAGATDTGRPYFVMELVRGVPITEYCDKNKLSTQQRLELYIAVCQAIQHAHQKGVIHRDIKPSNVMVTLHDGNAVPKVIDFGIAKATNQKLTEKTLFTNYAQMIGTPAYMSPEQAEMSGLDVDTRTDVYSLGVLLYELLTGTTPFPSMELLSMGYGEMQKIIAEKEPPRPSTRLSTMQNEERTVVAKNRSMEVNALAKTFKGDLDWIVMKALEKDRTHRYETANGLATDLKRYLNHEPVVARPPSSAYRFQKLVRRNKLAFAAAGAVACALLLGIIATTWQASRATHAMQEALAAQTRESVQRHKAEANEKKAIEAQANEARQKAGAQQGLYESLVGQARATRLARQLGYRNSVFALLEHAKALDVTQKSLAVLRNEAVACLGDIVGLTPATFTNFSTNIRSACLAPSARMAAFGLSDGDIQLLEMPSGKKAAHFSSAGTNEVFGSVCFNSPGEQLFAICLPVATNNAQHIQFRQRSQLYSWACDADGRWRETCNRRLPAADNLVSWGPKVLATVIEVGSLNSDAPE